MRRLLHSSWLDSHFNLEAKAGKVEGLSLDRAQKLAHLLGNPQKKYPTIHLTGTNGKGSTAHILTQILVSVGLKVGTYGSPHLVCLNERYQLNGNPISDFELDEILSRLKVLEEESGQVFSWFELATAVGFVLFAEKNVDVAVVEVGKLGRYDATNILGAEICVVTNIGKDHIDDSGSADDIESSTDNDSDIKTETETSSEWERAIAWEKAGIINEGSTLILGNIREDLKQIFIAEKPGVTYVLGEDLNCIRNEKGQNNRGRKLDITLSLSSSKTPEVYRDLFLSMNGAHQGENATLALSAAKVFLENIERQALLTQENVRRALASCSLPGRFEILSEKEPLMILDGGHNPDGARASREALEDFLESFSDTSEANPDVGTNSKSDSIIWENSTLIFAMTKGKSTKEILKAFKAETFNRIICVGLAIPRGKDPYGVAKSAQELFTQVSNVKDNASGVQVLGDRVPEIQVIEDTITALESSMNSDLVFICGSLYLAGEVKAAFHQPQMVKKNYSGI